MHYLIVTMGVHEMAACCDYLAERVTSDDTVTVVGLAPGEEAHATRDAREALNVAAVRLPAVGDVQTTLLTDVDDPASSLLEAVATADANELLLSPNDERSAGLATTGSVVQRLLGRSPIPIVVVPRTDL
ncbi:universal stress protein [Natronorubrum daqingense]|uniref:Universal stress protein UspA n=1 Tax=Natronorubrum daqingense TaxID=588898 RepID=A0A1N7FHF9_9EURY|nr:universal stress protein [Natronorubrum daqingense]APX98451.1 universal stress protein UspA [Natronorubrum daqingense]SIR99779.1 Universal stress protein family protein [Natronorubrum daqingense]